jgi:hypothetical protein
MWQATLLFALLVSSSGPAFFREGDGRPPRFETDEDVGRVLGRDRTGKTGG